MAGQDFNGLDDMAVREGIRDAIARADRAVAAMPPVLASRISAVEDSTLGEEIVSRIRSMLAGLAADLLARASGTAEPGEWSDADVEALGRALLGDADLILHLQAQALEWQLAARLEDRVAIDPVVSPLLRNALESGDESLRAAALAFLEAQADWGRAQRQMELLRSELPDAAIEGLAFAPATDARAVAPEVSTGPSRERCAAQLIEALGADADGVLDVVRSGASLFLSALAARSGQARPDLVLATRKGQGLRIALGLRAAGVPLPLLANRMYLIDEGFDLPEGFAQLTPNGAAAILSDERQGGHE